MSFSNVDRFLKRCVSTGTIAGAVCWIGSFQDELFCKAYGSRQVIPRPAPMNKGTLFDTASLTKPIATALAVMTLLEEHKITLEDTVAQYLGAFKNSKNADITIMQLLTHTSGLPAWFPMYTVPGKKRLTFLAGCGAGQQVVYSCLGYILLGIVIQKITGCSLDTYCRDRLYNPLGLKNTFFNPGARDNIAATEFGNDYEKDMASQHADISKVPWRSYLIRGEVHDGNAYYAYDGVAGNAGLFSTAGDLATLMRAYVQGEIVSPQSAKYMTTDHTGGDEKRGVGWVMDPFPDNLSHKTFSHTGFTGTMLLCDPVRSLIVILLTNAVHPYVRKDIMAPIRKKVLQFAAEAVDKSTP